MYSKEARTYARVKQNGTEVREVTNNIKTT